MTYLRKEHGYASSHAPRGRSRPILASRLVLELILQSQILQAQISVHLLQAGVLVLQFPHTPDVRGFHTTNLAFPDIIRSITDAVFTANILGHPASLYLFQNLMICCSEKRVFIMVPPREALTEISDFVLLYSTGG